MVYVLFLFSRILARHEQEMKLTETQKRKLKEHVYRSQGCSLLEDLFLKYFWNWLVTKFPLWLAPNLITLIGFVVTVAGTLSVLLQDMGCRGEAPKWALMFCAVGIFIYQTLDGSDGKQARRIGLSNALGEFFDHGLDAIATFLYAVAAACTPGLSEHPILMLSLVVMVIMLCYVYHWQTYVCGILYFKRIDIAEAQFAQIIGLLLSFFFGQEVWHHQTLAFLGIPFTLKIMFSLGTVFFGVINLASAFYIILTQGVGKNGSTIAGTSVVSPIISPLLIMSVVLGYSYFSPSQFLKTNPILFITVFISPLSKITISMLIAIMTKSSFPLVDSIMIGPTLALVNVYCGCILPESYVLVCIALYNIYDILSMFITLCWEFSEVLSVPCLTVPSNHSSKKPN